MTYKPDPITPPTNRYINGGYLYASNGVPVNVADIWRDAQSYDKTLATSSDIKAFNNRGQLFDLSQKIALTGNQTLYLVGKTNGSSVHFNFEQYAATLGGIEIRLLEGVTATGGASLTPICRNMANQKTSTFTLTAGATVTDTGTQLALVALPETGGPASSRSPQSGGDMVEWILAGDTYYALELKNLTNDTKTVYANLSWYEPQA